MDATDGRRYQSAVAERQWGGRLRPRQRRVSQLGLHIGGAGEDARASSAGSGRTMALIGLRMMPTFPSSPLRFRTVGFPQYGSKAGLSGGTFPSSAPHDRASPVCLRPSCRRQEHLVLALSRGVLLGQRHRRASGSAALPQGPSLRSGLCCPSPSSLNRPHAPHSQTRRNFPALRVIYGAFAVLAWRQPRPSTSGSELSHTIPSQPVTLVCPRRVHRLHTPRLHRWGSPSSIPARDSALSIFPLQSASCGGRFRGFLVRSLAATGWVACLSGGPDRPCRRPPEAFTSELSVESVTLLAVGYNYSGIWVPPLAGLPPAGMVASFAAPGTPARIAPTARRMLAQGNALGTGNH